eukprot:3477118-Rhodomonas_salina.1
MKSIDTVCQRDSGGENGIGMPGTPSVRILEAWQAEQDKVVERGVGVVGTEMTGVRGVVVIMEDVCSEGVNVGHASAMMITIKEVEQIVVQR